MRNNILIILLFTTSAAFSQNKARKIDSLFKYCLENKLYSGSLLVIENNKILYNYTNGYSQPDINMPYTSLHSQNINSLGKQFTAMCILMLKEKKILNLDEKVKKYLPNFPYENVTVRHLLTHSSGIEDYYQIWKKSQGLFPKNVKYFSNNDILNLLVSHNIPLNFEPNSQSAYSNTGYVILAMIIEKVTNKSYSQFINENIFYPLKMNNTFMNNPAVRKENQVMPFSFTIDENKLQEYKNPIEKFTALTGDGGVYTNNTDIVKWNIALNNNTLISAKSWEESITSTILNDGKVNNFGFGWVVNNSPISKKKSIMHAGLGDGYRAMIYKELEDKNLIFLMSNNNSKYISEIYKNVLKIVHSLPFSYPKIAYEFVLEKQIAQPNAQNILAELKVNRSKIFESYEVDEKAINKLGYAFLDSKRKEEAILVFSINVVLFPESTNAMSSLEEAKSIRN